MGYTTDFSGTFQLDQPLSVDQQKYLDKFCETRRMRRDPEKAETFKDPVRLAVKLPIGEEGGYFVGNDADFGQGRDASILDYNAAPKGQPGLWCKWKPTHDGFGIKWSGAEKFYDYVEWLEYLIEHFLKPWGYVLSGDVSYQGEDSADFGIIRVKDNVVTRLEGQQVIPGEDEASEENNVEHATIEETLAYRVSHKRESVVNQAKAICAKLEGLVAKMERYPDALPNSLGELQGMGTTFDADCGALCALVEALNVVKGL